jgi:ribosomal protein S27AE
MKKNGLAVLPGCFVDAPDNPVCPKCGETVYLVPVFGKRLLGFLWRSVEYFYVECGECGRKTEMSPTIRPVIRDFFIKEPNNGHR